MRGLNRTTILYLDDERACLDVFALMFGDDYEIRTAETVDEARRFLVERTFDVVISDQTMPEIMGAEFLREVALAHPESRRIMLTGSAFVGALAGEIAAGVIHGFVTKPWVSEDILRAVERVSL